MQNSEEIFNNVKDVVDGDILLFHNNGKYTIVVLKILLEERVRQGYENTFNTISAGIEAQKELR